MTRLTFLILCLATAAVAQQTPNIAILNPASVPAGTSGSTLTIDGSGFAPGASVRWTTSTSTQNLPGVTVASATRITATIPAALLADAGSAQVAVVNTGGAVSTPLIFIVGPALSILAASTDGIPAGIAGSAFTITGTGFVTGATVRWTGRFRNGNLNNVNVVSGTSITAVIPGAFLALPDSAQVVVVNPDGTTSNPWWVYIFPAAGGDVTSLSPSSLPAGSGPATLTLVGTNFPPNPTVRWIVNGETTPLTNVQVVNNTRITATIPASLLTTPGSATVSVFTPSTVPSVPLEFTIGPPTPVTASVTISRPASPTDQPTVSVALPSAATGPLQGTLTLSFTPDASITGLPARYIDPAVKFAGSSNQTLNFTIPAGATTATLPSNGQFSQGTVAGTFTIAMSALTNATGLSVLPSSAPAATLQQAPAAPVITPGSVKIVNLTSSGFSVEMQGYTNTRSLTTANFTFTAAAGTQLTGGNTASVALPAAAMSAWFNSAAGQQSGGAFLLTIPFAYSGDTSALSSVSVTLSNSVGASAAVSGGR